MSVSKMTSSGALEMVVPLRLSDRRNRSDYSTDDECQAEESHRSSIRLCYDDSQMLRARESELV